jgi:LacI family transcriptional regulator
VKTSVTIQDVARAAGVSVSTVSRVLNHKVDVSAKTIQRVQQVIDELGYGSGLAAKSMRSRKTNVVGLLVPGLEQSYSLQIMRGVSRTITAAGFDLLIYTSSTQAKQNLANWEQKQVALLNGSVTDGMIVVAPYAHSFRTGSPIVAIDPHSEGADFPAVLSTNHAGVMAAMRYLFELGHRRIGFIGGRPALQSSQGRLQAYYDSLRESGLSIDSTLIKIGDYTQPTGYSCALRLLQQPHPPTAILAANDMTAFGVLAAAQDSGLRVPEDLSLIGFDNILECASSSPPLTTIDQSLELMGQRAAELLLQLMQGQPLTDQNVKVPTSLIIRRSCAAPSTAD